MCESESESVCFFLLERRGVVFIKFVCVLFMNH